MHYNSFDRRQGKASIESAHHDVERGEILLRVRYASGRFRDVAAPFPGQLSERSALGWSIVDGRFVTMAQEPTGGRLTVMDGSELPPPDGGIAVNCFNGSMANVYENGNLCSRIMLPVPSPFQWDSGRTYAYLGLAPLYAAADIITLPLYPVAWLLMLIWPSES